MRKMKGILIAFMVLFSVAVVVAQTDPHAKKLLDEVSKKYDAYRTIQSDFTFAAQQVQGESYSDKGTLYLNKPRNQYRINLSAQELIGDGKATWSILKEDKEVQVNEADNSTDAIGPNNLFTFYKEGFKYVSMDDERLGQETLNVIELSPIDTRKNYFKIKLRVNKNKHIHDVLIFDKSGARYTYTIKALYVNHQIPDTYFAFNKSNYTGYEVVDLR